MIQSAGTRLVRFNMRKLSLLDEDEFDDNDDDDDKVEVVVDEGGKMAKWPFLRAIRQLSRLSR